MWTTPSRQRRKPKLCPGFGLLAGSMNGIGPFLLRVVTVGIGSCLRQPSTPMEGWRFKLSMRH